MKSFKKFVSETTITSNRGIHSQNHNKEVSGVVRGVHDTIKQSLPSDGSVDEFLSNHENASGYVRDILKKMDSEDIKNHGLDSSESIDTIVSTLSDPKYSTIARVK